MCLTWRGLQTTKLCCNSVSSLRCLFCCVSIHSRAAPRPGHLAHLLLSLPCLVHALLSPQLFPLSSIYVLSLKPSLYASSILLFFTPLHSSSSPAWAGRLPGWGPRWCSGKSASSGSLSLQDGSAALLWPIWPRPVLAPACDYGPAGRRQSWRRKPVPVHSRLRACTLRCDLDAVLSVATRRRTENK